MAAEAGPLSNCCMHETFRMLGAEHAADLAREAEKWNRARTLLNDPQEVMEAQQPRRTRRIATAAWFPLRGARLRIWSAPSRRLR
jgi:hypothetical protein